MNSRRSSVKLPISTKEKEVLHVEHDVGGSLCEPFVCLKEKLRVNDIHTLPLGLLIPDSSNKIAS